MITNKKVAGAAILSEGANRLFKLSQRTHIALFKGIMPDLSVLQYGLANFDIKSGEMCTQLGLLEADCLSIVSGNALSAPSFDYANGIMTVRIPTSSLDTDVVGLQTGIPTFFVIRTISLASPATWVGFSHPSAALDNVIIGSVSDATGEGELRILGGEIQKSVSYRMTDLLLTI